MKIWEIDLTKEGKYSDLRYIWSVDTDYKTLKRIDTDIVDEYNLGTILSSNFEPYVDWSEVEVDTHCLVRAEGDSDWVKRYFARFENGKPYFWHFGATSWSIEGEDHVMTWKYYKLADKANE